MLSDTSPARLRAWFCVITIVSAAHAVSLAVGADAPRKEDAISYGEGGCGRLDGGLAVPCRGDNFEAYSNLACQLGRNYLHPLVVGAIVEAYGSLKAGHPSRVWRYGDLGWKKGGRIRPHRTHQNGLSADFFVPVVEASGAPAALPSSILNKFGYGLEFDREGKFGEMRIDWRAIADHLLVLEKSGKSRGVSLERVILTPDFHASLFATAPDLKRLAHIFMKTEAWIRHDEHYHVDFAVPERYRKPLTCR